MISQSSQISIETIAAHALENRGIGATQLADLIAMRDAGQLDTHDSRRVSILESAVSDGSITSFRGRH